MGRLGGGSGVCEYIACPLGFLLVSLERLWLPLARLWGPFGSLWGPFGSLWDPFASHWGPFGSLWGSIWPPLGALGALGGSLGCIGAYSRFLSKMGLQFRANGSHLRSLSTKVGLPEFNRHSRGFPGSPGSDLWPAARNPPSSRRGLG